MIHQTRVAGLAGEENYLADGEESDHLAKVPNVQDTGGARAARRM